MTKPQPLEDNLQHRDNAKDYILEDVTGRLFIMITSSAISGAGWLTLATEYSSNEPRDAIVIISALASAGFLGFANHQAHIVYKRLQAYLESPNEYMRTYHK